MKIEIYKHLILIESENTTEEHQLDYLRKQCREAGFKWDNRDNGLRIPLPEDMPKRQKGLMESIADDLSDKQIPA